MVYHLIEKQRERKREKKVNEIERGADKNRRNGQRST
jgi:hypothetical protein